MVGSFVDAYVGLDSDGRVLEWNGAATAMLGWAAEEAVGQPLTELMGVSAGEQSDLALPALVDYLRTGRSPVVGNVVAQGFAPKTAPNYQSKWSSSRSVLRRV